MDMNTAIVQRALTDLRQDSAFEVIYRDSIVEEERYAVTIWRREYAEMKAKLASLQAAKNAKRNAQRRTRDSLMRDLGLTKVRGNLGGTYWE